MWRLVCLENNSSQQVKMFAYVMMEFEPPAIDSTRKLGYNAASVYRQPSLLAIIDSGLLI
jgi:hypothetical protein